MRVRSSGAEPLALPAPPRTRSISICAPGAGPGLAAAAMPEPRTCVRLFLLELAVKKIHKLS